MDAIDYLPLTQMVPDIYGGLWNNLAVSISTLLPTTTLGIPNAHVENPPNP